MATDTTERRGHFTPGWQNLVAPAAMIALLAAPVAANKPAASAGQRATGTFSAEVTPEDGTRFRLKKVFLGALAGTSTGTMVGDTVATAYVAIERFTGTLDGRQGSFLLLHRGYVMPGRSMTIDGMIAPNSGTGQLAGISGKFDVKIEGGEHRYVLDYTLPK